MKTSLIRSIVPVRFRKGPESLIIEDYRPTFYMSLTAAGFVVFAIAFLWFLFRTGAVDEFALWVTLILAIACLLLSIRGTLREVYSFGKVTQRYVFVRRFVHRKEVIVGDVRQFRAVRVHTTIDRDENQREYHTVSLLQDGLLLGGSPEQPLRSEIPIMNFYSTEHSIAAAVSEFLEIELLETSD